MTVSGEKRGGLGISHPIPRRRWTDEEKQRIVAESEAPGSSVSIVARRHDLNANMLFTWRREFRRREPGAGVDQATFVPAVIALDEPAADRPATAPREPGPDIADGSAHRPSGLIEIVLGGCRRVIVDRDVSAAALARVVGVLERQ
jgi:transposase